MITNRKEGGGEKKSDENNIENIILIIKSER